MRTLASSIVLLGAVLGLSCGSISSTSDAGSGIGGTTGSAGTSGAAGTTGSAGRGGTTGQAGGGGAAGRKTCQTDGDCQGFSCCGGFCVNTKNDILNCGGCNLPCPGGQPYCANGTCGAPPCSLVGAQCIQGQFCCAGSCCATGQLCCSVTQGPSFTGCFDPVNGTCPTGCASCVCTAPTTPIATPSGERPIADLRAGDLVYSIDRGRLAVVPIARVHREPVTSAHHMVELRLAHGAVLLVSPSHPTADGRLFGDLAAGDRLDGVAVTGARVVGYDQPYTFDILPASDTGAYFAGGVLIGSTLARSEGIGGASLPAAPSQRRASLAAPSRVDIMPTRN
jgi:hypothetical protein